MQHNSWQRRRKARAPRTSPRGVACASPRGALHEALHEALQRLFRAHLGTAPGLVLAGTMGLAGWACAPSAATSSQAPGRGAPAATSSPEPPRGPATSDGAASKAGPAPHDALAPPVVPPVVEPCDPFTCLRFPTAAAALLHVLELDAPEALGVGESHARAQSEHIASATARFTSELLPAIAERSEALVVELLAPPSDCRRETRERVAQEEREITEGQASTNQNQFLQLGHEAKRLGVTPYILRATCDDLDAIAAAGEEGVLVIMETIAHLTVQEVERLLARRPPERARHMVLAYGGALHNDLAPRPGRERWSYGPRLQELTGGSYTELDLIVPEHIQDTDSWRAQPWYDSVPALSPESSVLLQIAPRRWVLFLSASRPAEPRSGSQEPAQEL